MYSWWLRLSLSSQSFGTKVIKPDIGPRKKTPRNICIAALSTCSCWLIRLRLAAIVIILKSKRPKLLHDSHRHKAPGPVRAVLMQPWGICMAGTVTRQAGPGGGAWRSWSKALVPAGLSSRGKTRRQRNGAAPSGTIRWEPPLIPRGRF